MIYRSQEDFYSEASNENLHMILKSKICFKKKIFVRLYF